MITQLDTQSWSKELVTGNAEFVQTPNKTLYVVSNVKKSGFGDAFGNSFSSIPYSFAVLQSAPVPPAVGPGAVFISKQVYEFPQPNTTFDPVATFDPASGLLHIIGTQDSPSNSQLNDLIKFTYNTNSGILSGPSVISAGRGSRARNAYDITMAGSDPIIAFSVSNPAIGVGSIVGISTNSEAVIVYVTAMAQPFLPGQLVLIEGVENNPSLNGQVLQVQTATPTYFVATVSNPGYAIGFGYLFGSDFGNETGFGSLFGFDFGSSGVVPDTGQAVPVGNSLIVLEWDNARNAPVPGSTVILETSPSRSGDTYDGVSLLTTANGIDLYYQSHPKLLTFVNQVFSIWNRSRLTNYNYGFGTEFGADFGEAFSASVGFGNDFGASFGLDTNSTGGVDWNDPELITNFQGRFSDTRLDVQQDSLSNQYLCQTYYTAITHPEGLLGNILVGTQPVGGEWRFTVKAGSISAGSPIQGALSISQANSVNLGYLLEPFISQPNTAPLIPSFPLHVASVDPVALNITDTTGVFDEETYTWLRGTKSLLDNQSDWAFVGENQTTTTISETQIIPALAPYALLVAQAPTYWMNTSVTDNSGSSPISYTAVISNPQASQYTVLPNGEYTFNAADASVQIKGVNLSNNQITVTGTNIANLYLGMTVLFSGLTTKTYLNGQMVVVTGINISRSTFTASFFHADDPEASDTGLAGRPLTITYSYVSSTLPAYLSRFNTPPTAYLNPISATAFRNQPLLLDASSSVDYDADALAFTWTENSPSPYVTLTPNDDTATILVSYSIGGNPQARITNVVLFDNVLTLEGGNTFVPGQVVRFSEFYNATFLNNKSATIIESEGFGTFFGAGFGNSGTYFTASFAGVDYPSTVDFGFAGVDITFDVGVVVEDVAPDLTPIHRYSPVTSVEVASNGLTTVTSTINSVAVGEQVMLFNVETGSNYTFGSEFGLSFGGVITPLYDINDKDYFINSVFPGGFTGTTSIAPNPRPLTVVTGSVIPQYQFATSLITIPYNIAPYIAFPNPPWDGVPSITVDRNLYVTIAPNSTSPDVYPVTVFGVTTDFDDVPSYLWEQLSGTTVLPGPITPPQTLPNSQNEVLTFNTRGVNLSGEALMFRLTVDDLVNPLATGVFTVNVVPYAFYTQDSRQLSRSFWQESDPITNVAVDGSGVLTVLCANTFTVGQTVYFSEVATATFLNGQAVTVLTVSPTQFTAQTLFAPYSSTMDMGYATANARLSQRNTPQIWGDLDESSIYNDMQTVKRDSLYDGTTRYLLISPNSVIAYYNGGIVLNKLVTPDHSMILDAVGLEDGSVLILTDSGSIMRYFTPVPNLNSDNPSFILTLGNLSQASFDTIVSTISYANIRVLALSGTQGTLLIQINNTTMAVQQTFTLSVEADLVSGSDNVQFIRLSQVESLKSGKVLLGTVTHNQATIASITIENNALTVGCSNTFKAGDQVTLSGLVGSVSFLNGVRVGVISSTASEFIASLQTTDLATVDTTSSIALATSFNDGTTYETLIDLGTRQILGTWQSSNLKNQYVTTGEVMFVAADTYDGRPEAPALGPVAGGTGSATLTWTQQRPDLVTGYTVEYASAAVVTYENCFNPGISTVYCTNTFSPGQIVTFVGLIGVPGLNGQVVTILTATSSYITFTTPGTVVGSGNEVGNAYVYLQPFTVVANVNSGSIFTTTVALSSGTYVFGVQANSSDGNSPLSNIQAGTVS